MEENIEQTLGYTTKAALVKLKKDIQTTVTEYDQKAFSRYASEHFL